MTEDFGARVRLQDKRMRKGNGILAEALAPICYGPADARHVLITWGSTYLPCREAVDILNADGCGARMVHFPQVWPIDVSKARSALGLDQPGQQRRRHGCTRQSRPA